MTESLEQVVWGLHEILLLKNKDGGAETFLTGVAWSLTTGQETAWLS